MLFFILREVTLQALKSAKGEILNASQNAKISSTTK
jgi:hypothetical protein